MNIRWQKIQNKLNHTIDQIGTFIQTLTRSTDDTNAYSTGSTITFGYGDPVISYETGSAKAIVSTLTGAEIIVEAGFTAEDYLRLQIKSTLDLEHWDLVIYPSGSGVFYHVEEPSEQRMEGIIISKYARIRRLLPRSGSLF